MFEFREFFLILRKDMRKIYEARPTKITNSVLNQNLYIL